MERIARRRGPFLGVSLVLPPPTRSRARPPGTIAGGCRSQLDGGMMGALWSKLKKAKRANTGVDAPDFTLRGARGDEFTLSSLRGEKRALLIFYPQDMTSG